MFLSCVLCPDGRAKLALRQGSEAAFLTEQGDIGQLAQRAAQEGVALATLLLRRGLGDPVDIAGSAAQGLLLPPLPAGRPLLLPTAPGEDAAAITPVPPHAALGIAAGGTLEGGVAALSIVLADGQALPIGWLITHAGSARPGQPRPLACGPELCLATQPPPLAGQTRLLADAAVLTEFGLPDTDLTKTAPHQPHPAGTVLIFRPSRWLLRPRGEHLLASVETGIPALGLPLRNPLGQAAASARTADDPVRRKA